MKTNTYCRRLGRQTLSGWRDRSDPDVAIKAYAVASLVGYFLLGLRVGLSLALALQ